MNGYGLSVVIELAGILIVLAYISSQISNLPK